MKVLIVDDSIVFRSAIKTALTESQIVEEVDVAANGKIAINKLKQFDFDAITLDLEMPVMDGVETIKEIRKFDAEIAIIIFSAQNLDAANKTLKALEMGADDFVQKLQNSNSLEDNLKNIREQLIPRFDALVKQRSFAKNVNSVQKIKTTSSIPISSPVTHAIHKKININTFKSDLVVIGCSTGGPDLLMKLFKDIQKLDVPVLLVQHMPPLFTTQLANALDAISPMNFKEAEDGDIVKPGCCYIAPGDYHMRLIKVAGQMQIKLDQEPKVCFVRPAVDCLFESVAKTFDGKVAAFILTGMGTDGLDGCLKLKEKNTAVVIQDEETAVVWGMPGAIYRAGCYDLATNPKEIIKIMNKVGSQ